LKAQQIETMLTDFLGTLDDQFDLLRQSLPQQVQSTWHVMATKKEGS
jgi:hypothetical protein